MPVPSEMKNTVRLDMMKGGWVGPHGTGGMEMIVLCFEAYNPLNKTRIHYALH